MKFAAGFMATVAGVVLASSTMACGMNVSNPTLKSELKTTSNKNIVEVAQEAGSFGTLLAAAEAADLVETLATTDNITVFAPTDEAFAQIPKETLDALLADKEALVDVLTYHVVGAKVPAADAVKLTEAVMLNGKSTALRVCQCELFINESKVILTDIKAKNGIIHVIDAVLIPQN